MIRVLRHLPTAFIIYSYIRYCVLQQQNQSAEAHSVQQYYVRAVLTMQMQRTWSLTVQKVNTPFGSLNLKI